MAEDAVHVSEEKLIGSSEQAAAWLAVWRQGGECSGAVVRQGGLCDAGQGIARSLCLRSHDAVVIIRQDAFWKRTDAAKKGGNYYARIRQTIGTKEYTQVTAMEAVPATNCRA